MEASPQDRDFLIAQVRAEIAYFSDGVREATSDMIQGRKSIDEATAKIERCENRLTALCKLLTHLEET